MQMKGSNMKISRTACAAMGACTLLGVAGTGQAMEAAPAQPAGTEMLVYISPDKYKHSNRLSHYNFREYWYEEGPMVEPYVDQVLATELGSVGLCKGAETANTLVWLKPNMTYNSTLQRFNGKVTAEVYTGDGQTLGTYVGVSRRDSFLDIVPAYQLDAAYKAAMQDLAAKMKADQRLQAAMKRGAADGGNSTSCAMLPLLPVARVSNPLMEIFRQ
jgi:hypothetical protein